MRLALTSHEASRPLITPQVFEAFEDILEVVAECSSVNIRYKVLPKRLTLACVSSCCPEVPMVVWVSNILDCS